MRTVIGITAIFFIAGCESMSQKVDTSRQDRCERADWALVGERDGVSGSPLLADRYEYICGELFKAEPYKEGFAKGRARKPGPAS